MPGKGAVSERPLTVQNTVSAPVSLPRRVQSFARSKLPDLHHPRPRQVELIALDLLITIEAIVLLVVLVTV